MLLDSQLRAKTADFGNSRMMDLDPDSSPETLTSLPGTLEYMPPEAQGGRVTYDPSLDVFSFGHLSLFIITQTPVRPLLPPSYDDSTGELRARSEVKRHVQFVEAAEQLLSENRSLVALIKQCLHNTAAQRPHTGELVTRLQEMLTRGEWSPPSPPMIPTPPLFLSTQPGIVCAGGEDSLSSTPADAHSPSHGKDPVGADSETDTVTQRRGTVLHTDILLEEKSTLQTLQQHNLANLTMVRDYIGYWPDKPVILVAGPLCIMVL